MSLVWLPGLERAMREMRVVKRPYNPATDSATTKNLHHSIINLELGFRITFGCLLYKKTGFSEHCISSLNTEYLARTGPE